VKFELQSKGGNNLYLDDINIWSGDQELVGLEEAELFNGLVLYPNPAQDLLNVSFSLTRSRTYRLDLYDLGGRLCFSTEVVASGPGEQVIQIPNQSAGMYLLKMESAGESITRKVAFR
jgi:hypothetical protein